MIPVNTLLQRRNLIMLKLMLNSGLRSHEVCELRVKDLTLPAGKLLVRGKGGRQRIIWLGPNDLTDLLGYIRDAAPAGLIFQTGHRQKIDTRFLRTILSRIGSRSGLKRVHPHLLRHTFATDLLRETKNLPLVQKALGHSDIGTTQIYLHIVDDELEAAMKGFRQSHD